MRILLAVDESESAVRAVQFVVRLSALMTKDPDISLVNVDEVLAPSIQSAIGAKMVVEYHAMNGERVLEMAKKILDDSRLDYDTHLLVGDPAETIVKLAASSNCDLVVMGPHGGSPLKALLLGSVTSKVLSHSQVPVTVVI